MIEPLLHTLAETAKILGISEKTLMEHVRQGRIRCIHVGNGKRRVHRGFTDKNINTFIEKQKHREVAPCPSAKTLKAPTTSTNSKSTVIDFVALQKPGTKKMPS